MNPSIFGKTPSLVLNLVFLITTMSIGTAPAVSLLSSPADFSGSEAVIDFEGFPLDIEIPQIDDVDFLLVGTANDGLGPGSEVGSLPREFGPAGVGLIDPFPNGTFFPAPVADLQLTFANPIHRLGFEMRTTMSDIDITVQCISNNVVVDQFTFSGATDFDYHFYAFESSNSFDEVIIGVADNSGWNLDNLRYESLSPPIPTYACAGFEAPLDNGPVTVTHNKVLPLRAQLSDDNDNPIDNVSILSKPVIQVTFVPEFSGIPIDITGDALWWWKGTKGNIFKFKDDRWKFNLKTKHYTAPGIYNIGIVSGDTSEYVITPACQVQFQRD